MTTITKKISLLFLLLGLLLQGISGKAPEESSSSCAAAGKSAECAGGGDAKEVEEEDEGEEQQQHPSLLQVAAPPRPKKRAAAAEAQLMIAEEGHGRGGLGGPGPDGPGGPIGPGPGGPGGPDGQGQCVDKGGKDRRWGVHCTSKDVMDCTRGDNAASCMWVCGCEVDGQKFCNFNADTLFNGQVVPQTFGTCESCPEAAPNEEGDCAAGLKPAGLADCKRRCKKAPENPNAGTWYENLQVPGWYSNRQCEEKKCCGCEENGKKFCNFDNGQWGKCEDCPEEGCDEHVAASLPNVAAKVDCLHRCGAPKKEDEDKDPAAGRRPSPGKPCGCEEDGNFCNFDRCEGEKCPLEGCPDPQHEVCGECEKCAETPTGEGLPPAGLAAWKKSCKK